MKSLSKYIKLIGKMFEAREAKDEPGEDKITDELDHVFYKEMTQEERDRENEMIFFGTREKYLAFINAWKTFIKEGKARKYKVPYEACPDGMLARIDGTWKCKNPLQCFFWKSDLGVEHHVLYALLRNKPLKKMFKRDKLQTGAYRVLKPHWSLHCAKYAIEWAAKDGYSNHLELLLAPFDGTITIDEVRLASRKLQRIYEKTKEFSDLELE